MIKKSIFNRKMERGQSFMELAISLVFLLTLFSAAVDLGWALYTMISLRDAAQEAASFGSMCTDANKVTNRFKGSTSAPIDMNQVADFKVCFSSPGAPSVCKVPPQIFRGDDVTITIRYMHRIVTPFVGAIINSQSYPLVVTVSDTVMQTNQSVACGTP